MRILNYWSTLIIFVLFVTLSPSADAAEKDPPFSVRGLGGGGAMFSPFISKHTPGLLLLSCDMGGTYRSTNNGEAWELLHYNQGLRRMHMGPPPQELPHRIYWVTDRKQICVSDDKGATWSIQSGDLWLKPPSTWKPQTPEQKWQTVILDFIVLPGTPETLLLSTGQGLWRGNNRNWEWALKGTAGPLLLLDKEIFVVMDNDKLFKSVDNGQSYKQISQLPGKIVSLTGASDDKQSIMLAGVPDVGIVRSQDKGKSWQVVKTPYENESILRVTPGQTNIAYAMQTGRPPAHRLLRTQDGGATWQSIFNMDPAGKSSSGKFNVDLTWLQTMLRWSYYFTTNGLAVSQTDPNFMLATTQGELFFSQNGGNTWQTRMHKTLPALADGSLASQSIGLEVTSCWGYYFDPHDAQREYIAYTDIGFARSGDQGKSWTWSAKGSPWSNTFYDLAFDPDKPGRIYAAVSSRHDIPHFTDISRTAPGYRVHGGGVVVSDDFGATWKRAPYPRKGPGVLPNQVCTTVLVDPNSQPGKRTLYAAIYGELDDTNAGLYISTDNAASWSKVSAPWDNLSNRHIYRLRRHPQSGELYCLITGFRYTDPKISFGIEGGGGIWASSDNGKSWRHISAGQQLNRWATALAFDPQNPSTLYVAAATPQGASSGGAYRTKDNGHNWEHILTDKDIFNVAGGSRYDHCMAIAVHPDNPKAVFVGTSLHGILYSLDGGASWAQYQGFPFPNAQSISFNPRQKDKIYVTTFGAGVFVLPMPKEAIVK